MPTPRLEQRYLRDAEGKRIFCNLYLPQLEHIHREEAIIMCPPIYEERMQSQRVCHNFLSCASQAGRIAASVDYYGVGDSDGESEEMTIQSMVNDVCEVVHFLRHEKGVGRIHLCGLRMGAVIAVKVADKTEVTKMVLWAPVLEVEKYFDEQLKMCLTTQTVMFKEIRMKRSTILDELLNHRTPVVDGYALNNMYGYLFSREFYLEGKQTNLLTSPPAGAREILVMEISPEGSVSRELLSFENACKKLEKVTVTMMAVREKRFWIRGKEYRTWPEELFKKTLDWLDTEPTGDGDT